MRDSSIIFRTFSSSSPPYFFLFLFTVTVTHLHILLHNCRRRPPSPTTHLDIVFHKSWLVALCFFLPVENLIYCNYRRGCLKYVNQHDIDVPDMDASYRARKKPRQSTTSGVSNLHHYKHDCLFSVLDLQLHELNARFDEENIELLQCVSCLSPSSSFARFDAKKLLRMVELYPNDFVDVPEVVLRHQLQTYVRDVREDKNFAKLKGLSDLCAKLVETNKCNTYNLVYKLLKLALVLPVATASVERVFSAMNLVKSLLCNKMSDEWLNNRLVTLIERDVLATIDNDVNLDNFQQMDDRRFSL
ncbi:unnamed protein product [Trifolium pratense]|uniref:Uncharacterized protein n=1 Tax=Trifolium pratense TaxID=57577 RepID=A0ACB0MDB2_TRIPR|nr:unnamed protein product [Trifolium pratense]